MLHGWLWKDQKKKNLINFKIHLILTVNSLTVELSLTFYLFYLFVFTSSQYLSSHSIWQSTRTFIWIAWADNNKNEARKRKLWFTDRDTHYCGRQINWIEQFLLNESWNLFLWNNRSLCSKRFNKFIDLIFKPKKKSKKKWRDEKKTRSAVIGSLQLFQAEIRFIARGLKAFWCI